MFAFVSEEDGGRLDGGGEVDLGSGRWRVKEGGGDVLGTSSQCVCQVSLQVMSMRQVSLASGWFTGQRTLHTQELLVRLELVQVSSAQAFDPISSSNGLGRLNTSFTFFSLWQ